MKKIILLLLLVLVSVTASARKSYITVYTYNPNGYGGDSNRIALTGDVPNDIEGFEYFDDGHFWRMYNVTNVNYKKYSTGEILNLLSEYGYEVESITSISNSDEVLFILSKEISSGQTISKGDVNEDGEVNIADVNGLLNLILGIVRENPSILEQIKK